MPSRRLLLAGALGAVALPAFGQSRKPTDGTTTGLILSERIDGQYISQGFNSDRTRFNGVARITQDGSSILVTWVVNGETTKGTGVVEGRVVTVEWGDKYPSVYVIMPDGSLHGTYSNGTAVEKLTPR